MGGVKILLAIVLTGMAIAPVAGCAGEEPDSDSDDGVTVVLDRESVSPGGSLKARVRNRTDEQITYGLAYRLQSEMDGEFTEVDLPDRAVIQIALVANPGETGPPVTIEIPKDAEPGRWRVLLGAPGSEPALSAEFDVV